MKSYQWQENVGKARYVISHHDGVKTHSDKSPFFDISIFGRKPDALQFVKELETKGYIKGLPDNQQSDETKLMSFDAFKKHIDDAKMIGLNSDLVVYNITLSDDLVDLHWVDEDGARFFTRIERIYNDMKMYVEPDGEIVVFDSEGDTNRVLCFKELCPV